MTSCDSEAAWLCEPRLQRAIRWVGWILLALMLLGGAIADWKNTRKGGSVDLRNRIVGARLLSAGIDPYTYFWKRGDPEEFIDLHCRQGEPANRITISPTALAVHMPLGPLNYKTIQFIWIGLEWLGLFLLAGLLAYLAPPRRREAALWLALFLGGCGEVWRLHCDRGQFYIVQALIWGAALAVLKWRPTWGDIAAGLLLGVGAALRPTFVLGALPLVIARRGRPLIGMTIGGALAFSVTFAVGDLALWRSYFKHMEDIGQMYLRVSAEPPAHWVYPERFPHTVEGHRNLDRTDDFGRAHDYLRLQWTRVLPKPVRAKAGPAALALLVAAVAWWMWRRGAGRDLAVTMALGMTLAAIADHFVPAPRHFYNNVLWLPPLAVLWSQSTSFWRPRPALAIALFIAACGALGIAALTRFDFPRVSDYAVAALTLVALLQLAARQEKATPDSAVAPT